MPVSYQNVPSAYEAERLNDGVGNIVTAAEADDAHDHSIGTGAPHTAAGVGADAAGTAAAGDTAHLGAFAHGDIATNSAARHTQGTDQALDTGGANEVTAANAKDAVTKKHTQNTDQYLDFGGANQVAVADAKDAVDKKHTRSHALDSSSDHSIGGGAEGQCIGVSGGALGWVTPGGGGGGGNIVFWDFPSTGTKDWKTDGPGTEGIWEGTEVSGNMSDWDVLEFNGDELVFQITAASGNKEIIFWGDISSDYYDLTYLTGLQVGMTLVFTSLAASGNVLIFGGIYNNGTVNDSWSVYGGSSGGVLGFGGHHYATNTISVVSGNGAITTGGSDNTIRGFLRGDTIEATCYGSSRAESGATLNIDPWYVESPTMKVRVRLFVENGKSVTGKISNLWAGPMYPLP